MRYKWATGYWQEIIKNTADYDQGDNEFKIISKLKQWLCFGRSFVIVIDIIIILLLQGVHNTLEEKVLQKHLCSLFFQPI